MGTVGSPRRGTDMTNRELLELAAKAAGFVNQGYCEVGFLFTGTGESGAFYKWNPLTDDGDALQLLMELLQYGIELRFEKTNTLVGVGIGPFWCEEVAEPHPDVALRRAIVRAAAEIGKAIP